MQGDASEVIAARPLLGLMLRPELALSFHLLAVARLIRLACHPALSRRLLAARVTRPVLRRNTFEGESVNEMFESKIQTPESDTRKGNALADKGKPVVAECTAVDCPLGCQRDCG